MENKKKKIDDVGEKVGGAKKDVYMSRGGLTLEDIDSMDEREYEKHIKKDHVWPKPNFKNMLSEGYSAESLYFIKEIRDALPAKPKLFKKAYIEVYIELVNIYRDSCKELKDAASLYGASNIVKSIADERGFTHLKAREHLKAFKVANMSLSDLEQLKIEAEIQDFPNQFHGTLKGLTVRKYNTYSGERYIIMKNNRRLYKFQCEHSTLESAMKEIKENIVPKLLEEKQEEKRKKSTQQYTRPQLKNIVRTGPDYRKGKNVDGEDLLKEFEFRGIEYGNWNTQADRQSVLNHTYDASKDLSRTVKAPDNFISMQGYKDKRLAIAFGSRGVSGAVAHYEPANVVINFTKMNGAGSYAHEWAHALDDFIGIKCGFSGLFSRYGLGFIRNKEEHPYPEIQESFKNLLSIMKSKECTDEEIIEMRTKSLAEVTERITRILEGFENVSFKSKDSGRRNVNDEEKALLIKAKENLLEKLDSASLKELNDTHKKITNKLPDKDKRDLLELLINRCIYLVEALEEAKKGIFENRPKIDTHYYKKAKEIDKLTGKSYLQTNPELFARAFESYVEDCIRKEGYRSDYLVHSTSNSSYNSFLPYPAAEERLLINEEIRKFLELVVKTFSTPTDCISLSKSEEQSTAESFKPMTKKEFSNMVKDVLDEVTDELRDIHLAEIAKRQEDEAIEEEAETTTEVEEEPIENVVEEEDTNKESETTIPEVTSNYEPSPEELEEYFETTEVKEEPIENVVEEESTISEVTSNYEPNSEELEEFYEATTEAYEDNSNDLEVSGEVKEEHIENVVEEEDTNEEPESTITDTIDHYDEISESNIAKIQEVCTCPPAFNDPIIDFLFMKKKQYESESILKEQELQSVKDKHVEFLFSKLRNK